MGASYFGNVKRKKAEGAIMIDVGSGSVGGAAAIFRHGEKPRIVFETREDFPIQNRLNHQRLFSLTMDSANRVFEVLSKKGLPRLIDSDGRKVSLKRIICNFSSPWHVSTTKNLHFKFEKPFAISVPFINDVLSHESNNFVSKVLKDTSNKSFDHGERPLIFGQEVLAAFVNGYPVLSPMDLRANEFEMVLFMSAFPANLIKGFEKICGKSFPHIEPDFISETSMYFHVLKDLFPEEGSFIIVHISGETTDVSVIKKNVITETISFPLGRNFIIRRLIDEVPGVTPAVALSMIKVNSEGVATPKLSEKLTRILSQAEADWIELFGDSMRDFAEDFFLPTRVFVLAGDNSAKTFSDLITKKKLPVRGIGTPPLVAEEADSALFSSSVESTSHIDYDPFLAAEAHYFNQECF